MQDYLTYAKDLTSEYSDILDGNLQAEGKPPLAPTFNFATPANGSAVGKVASPSALNASTATTPTVVEEEEEDVLDEDVEPSLQVRPTDAEILCSQRVELVELMAEKKKWQDKGKGTVTLRKSTAESANRAPYLVFTTDSGRILLNAALPKGMKPTINPKAPANVLMMLFTKNEVSGKTENGTYLLRCEGGEGAARQLKEVIENSL